MEWLCVQMVWKKDIKITVPYMESGKQQWPHNIFPWKAKSAKRYKNSKEKKCLKVWCEQESEICHKEFDINHKLSHHTTITHPSTLKRIQVHFPSLFSQVPAQNGKGAAGAFIPHQLSFLQSADTTWPHLLLSKAPWRLWTSSWINTVVFLGLLGKISLLYNPRGNSCLESRVGLCV